MNLIQWVADLFKPSIDFKKELQIYNNTTSFLYIMNKMLDEIGTEAKEGFLTESKEYRIEILENCVRWYEEHRELEHYAVKLIRDRVQELKDSDQDVLSSTN